MVENCAKKLSKALKELEKTSILLQEAKSTKDKKIILKAQNKYDTARFAFNFYKDQSTR